MKLVLIALATILSLGAAYPRYGASTYGLKEDIDDFIALIPKNEILNIVTQYLANDQEVQAAAVYIQSQDFKDVVTALESIPEYREFLKYLQDSGLNVYYYINKLHDFLKLPPFVPRQIQPRGTGIRGMLDDIEAILPVQKLKDMFYDKLANSPAFAALVDRMRSDDFKSIVNTLKANAKYQDLIQKMTDAGIDVAYIREILEKIFGWNKTYAARDLKQDFQDFLNLIPVDQVTAIVMDYLANDAEVQEAMEFIQSPEFTGLVQEVEKVQDYINFLNYLQQNGLDVYGLINKVHEILGIPPLTPPMRRHNARRGVGIRGMVDEIEAILPLDAIKALYEEKLKTSPDFKALIEMMQGETFKNMILQLQANKTVQEIVAKLKSHGLDIKAVEDLLNKIFGWGIGSRRVARDLKQDFQDFLDLLPVDKIHAIAFDYIANDAEVQEAVAFVKSPEFTGLVQEIEKVQDYINFLNYLQKNGVDVYKVINRIHRLIGLPPLTPPMRRHNARRGVGIRGMVKDIEAILPLDAIKALYEEKLKTSPDFQALIEMMQGETFKNMILQLQANKTVQEIVANLKSHGLDIDAVADLLNKMFGWGIGSRRVVRRAARDLKQDFQDFLNLIPVDQVTAIVMDYLANDAEVQEAMEFIQSPEFTGLVQEVEKVQDYINFLNYLQQNGLDVYGLINKVHEILGIPPLTPPMRRHNARRGVGIRGMVDEIEAILPLDAIKALYEEKLKTSPDFKALIEMMQGETFKNMILQLQANKTVQEIVAKLKSHGLDIKAVEDLLNKIFGWGIGSRRVVRRAARDLKQDFQDFLNLIPVDQVTAIVMDYLANDAEVQEAMEFIQSPEFTGLVQEVEKVQDYINFLNYLQQNGLDVYGLINKVHEILGIPPLTPPMRRHNARRGVGIRGMVDEIEAILPLDAIKALYEEKLKTSPDFKALIEMMQGETFKNMILQLQANKTVQEIVAKLKSHGLDIKAVEDLLNKIFGWGIGSRRVARNLKQDLQDFLDLVPRETTDILMDYLANDAEVQEAMRFIQSPEFTGLVQEVEKVQDYINFLNYLQKNNVDIYGLINKIHAILGIPPLTPPMRRHHARRGVGIRGLVDDIEAILPLDAIKALYEEKLKTSPDFKALIEMMQGETFKNMILQLQANKTVQDIVAKLESHGLDIKAYEDLLNKIFGWGIGSRRTMIYKF